MPDEINPKWVPLADKLRKAADAMDAAIVRHEQAVIDAKAALDAAEEDLKSALADARGLVKEVAEIPPGQYPAVTG